MSIRAVISYRDNEYALNEQQVNPNDFDDIIKAIRQVQKKTDEFLTNMISTDLKEEPQKKMKLDNNGEDEANNDDENSQNDQDENIEEQINANEEGNIVQNQTENIEEMEENAKEQQITNHNNSLKISSYG